MLNSVHYSNTNDSILLIGTSEGRNITIDTRTTSDIDLNNSSVNNRGYKSNSIID